MAEEWRDIAGFEGRYQVSSAGRIRSVPFYQRYLLRNGKEAFRLTKQKILSQQIGRHGYALVSLHLNNVRSAFSVHHLVASTFLVERSETINHIDGNKSNNSVENLEYITYSANHNHAVDLGLNTQAIGVRSPKTGVWYPSMSRAASSENISFKTVSKYFIREPNPCTR